MTPSRLTSWTVFAVAGFALLVNSSGAQELTLPSKSGAYNEAVGAINNNYKESRGIAAGELETAKKHFAAFAKYYADMVKSPLIYKGAQDPSVKDAKGSNIPPLDGFGGVIPDLQRFIYEPLPTSTTVTVDRADYIREVGNAIDAALKPIILENPDKIVRINAMRMLAAACKSGATAHYPTLIAILKAPNISIEIKNYALLAAGNLLSAYDLFDPKSRRHSNGWKQTPKGAGDKELAELVVEIEKYIKDPALILSGTPNFKIAEATADQKSVIRFIRRQAIKALGQVRFVAIPGPDGASTLYPAYTLARVCVSDPTLGVEPSPSECAEAAIGLANMSHFINGDPRKDYNADAAVEAVTAALVTFASPRAATIDDKSLPWRGYGLRLAEALNNWQALFDFAFNPMRPRVFAADAVPAELKNLIQRSQSALFVPLDKVGFDGKPDPVGGRVAIEELREYLKNLRERKDRKPLFTSVPATALYPQNTK